MPYFQTQMTYLTCLCKLHHISKFWYLRTLLSMNLSEPITYDLNEVNVLDSLQTPIARKLTFLCSWNFILYMIREPGSLEKHKIVNMASKERQQERDVGSGKWAYVNSTESGGQIMEFALYHILKENYWGILNMVITNSDLCSNRDSCSWMFIQKN